MAYEWNQSGQNPSENGDHNQNGNRNDNQNNGYYQNNDYYQNNTNGGFQPPFNQPPEDNEGKSAKTFGIVGLIISIVCCQVLGVVFGIIAVVKAGNSRRALGIETGDASLGKILGIIAIVLGVISVVSSIALIPLIWNLTESIIETNA